MTAFGIEEYLMFCPILSESFSENLDVSMCWEGPPSFYVIYKGTLGKLCLPKGDMGHTVTRRKMNERVRKWSASSRINRPKLFYQNKKKTYRRQER